MFEDADAPTVEFALGCQIDGDAKETMFWFYGCTATRPNVDAQTNEDIAYVMAKHGDPSQPDNIEEWLDQFEMFDIYEILPQILDMWKIETHQESEPKKV